MENLDIYAEIFLGFVGFSGIVATLGSTNKKSWTVVDKFRLTVLIVVSIAGMFLALFPAVIFDLTADERFSWQIALGLLGFATLAAITFTGITFSRTGIYKHQDFAPGVGIGLVIIGSSFAVVALLSAFDLVFQPSIGIYSLGLIALMLPSAVMFGLLVKLMLKDA